MDEELRVTFTLDKEQPIDCVFRIDATTFDYEVLEKKPQINGETLIGNKTSEELHLASLQGLQDLDEKVDGINVNLTQQIEETQQDVSNKYQELTNDIDGVASALDFEIQARETADTTTNQRITDVADELQQSIEENVVALQQEDTALQNQINAHSQTLTAYDTRITNNANAITQEATDRQNADDNLQEQIDGITASSDVKDIVGTYAELQAYDKSKLGNNDIIKVLQDETQENASTYYRYVTSTQSFTYIGKEGPFYTKSEADGLLNTKQNTLVSGTNIKTLNNQSLLGSGNIEIKATPDLDNLTVSLNDENKVQSIGSILQSGGYQKYWQGTKAEFGAIQVKDSNTLYEVLDDIVDIVTEIPTATVNDIGLVKPDGTTITIDDTGKIQATMPTITKSNDNRSGIVRYPDGRMEQWGLATSSNVGETEFTMNNSFIDANFQVFIEPRQAGDLVHYAIPSTTNKFKARIQNTNGAFMTCQFQWRAYGFYK